MYVEDKVSHRGPFPVEVLPEQTVAELKKQIEKEFEIPIDYQRWILGKELVTDDKSKLKDHNITKDGLPVFLYLVAPDKKSQPDKNPNRPSTSKIEPALLQQKSSKEKTEIVSSQTVKPEPEDTIEKVRTNVQNLQRILNENRLASNKTDLSHYFKPPDHTPKIVEVIPKASENKSKDEVRIIPIQIENKILIKEKNRNPGQASLIAKDEITIEMKPLNIQINKTEIKPDQSSPKILTSTEVKPNIQYVFPTIQNSYQDQFAKEKSPPISKQESMEKSLPSAANKAETLNGPSTSTTPKAMDLIPSQLSEIPPKAKEEDFEDFDSNTLKPLKEWECHLCTLLNPQTTDTCGACSSVRLQKGKQQPVRKHMKKKAPQPTPRKDQTYRQLMDLDNTDLVENIEPFECVICFLEVAPHEGVTLRECLHQFCKACLAHTVEFSEEAEVKCPYMDDDYACNLTLQDREIKALVRAEVYEQHLAKSVAQAENKIDKSFHCKTPDCKGWCIFEDNVNEFRCPVCSKTNCLTCQAIHMGMNCKQYQEKMNDESEIDDDARQTRDMLEEMVKNGEAIECPTCKVILMKKWGCDWLRCSMCKTEICWVTRGPRWGPGGKGDTSGGCQCGVNGVKCHPKCNYCH